MLSDFLPFVYGISVFVLLILAARIMLNGFFSGQAPLETRNSFSKKNGDLFIFSGEYKLDRMNGHGKFVYASSSKWSGYKYVGGYKNNLRNGFGVMKYPSGDIYKGGWKNDKKHG